jgi:hypothetical protein
MKKLLLVLSLFLTGILVNAQTDSTLQPYTGKYKFPDGSPVTEITVAIENGLLMATSAMGSTELKKTQGDVFEIVAYGGTATFKRNQDTKVIGVQIQVGDLNMEGTKTEGIVLSRPDNLYQGYFLCAIITNSLPNRTIYPR